MKKFRIQLMIVMFMIMGCMQIEKADNSGVDSPKELSNSQTNVEAIVLRREAFSTELSANGMVSALRKVDVRTKLFEPVLKINVKTGQRVKPDQLIAVLDTFELFHIYLRQKASYEKAMFEFSDKLVGLGFSDGNIENMPQEQLKNAEMQSGTALASEMCGYPIIIKSFSKILN